MLSFRSLGDARFSYSVDFSEYDYANISFFDESVEQILFHLSLRKAENRVVANRRLDGHWQREIGKRARLADWLEKVTIEFRGNRVKVYIDGRKVLSFRNRFSNMQEIHALDYTGGLVEESFELEGSANEERSTIGEIRFGEGLSVEGWAIDRAKTRQEVSLRVDGMEGPLSIQLRNRFEIAAKYQTETQDIGFVASLPGRIWDAVPAASDQLVIRAYVNDMPCGTHLTLTKDALVQRIEARLSARNSAEGMRDQLLAIEHVRFGGLWPRLTLKAQYALIEAAQRLGAMAFLEPVDGVSELLKKTMASEKPDPIVLACGDIRKRFGAAIRERGCGPAINVLRGLMGEETLPKQGEQSLILELVEAFCLRDELLDLYDHAFSRDLQCFRPQREVWHDSAILPFLLMRGRLSEVRAILYWLAINRDGWVVTPAVGWTMRRMLDQNGIEADEELVEDVVYAFMEFVNLRGEDYWDRSPCAELMAASVELLRRGDRISAHLRRDVEAFLLRSYGLSPAFWGMVQERSLELSLVMQAGKQAFREVRACVEDEEGEIETALRFFETYQNPQVGRFRQEINGPFRQKPLTDIALGLPHAEEALLRQLAFPGCPHELSDRVAGISCSILQRRQGEVLRATHYDLQLDVGREVTALVLRIARSSDGDFSGPLQSLLEKLTILASKRNAYLGIGLGLGLVGALAVLGRTKELSLLVAHLERSFASTPEEEQGALFRSPPVRASLRAVRDIPEVWAMLEAISRMPDAPGGKGDLEVRPPLSFLFDTIVVIFSCRPFLETRIDPMKKAWISRLEALGIPYVIVVGDGDGKKVGDVVYLDAPDDYEGLPQKTLKAVEWVYENTSYAHMLKIDDDCFLNVDAFFQSFSYRKFDYYGRRLTRIVGQTDRSWHAFKSTSARGIMELDKSPEPSEYADGGSAYTLSRTAMGALLQQATSERGKALIAGSFMEDKLVGDLLSFAGIRVQEEDYYVSVRRRLHKGAVPVPKWENGFNPSPLCGTKVVHLDSHEAQVETARRLTENRLYPSKIWPTHLPARLGADTNLLELVSEEAKLLRLNAEPLAVVACVRNEMFMLPRFLEHYRKLGVRCFLIADNCSDDGTLEYLLDESDVAVFSVDTDYSKSTFGVAWQMAVLANLRLGRWSLIADADELLVYADWENKALPELLAETRFEDVDAVRLYMLDMYPNGPLSAAEFKEGNPFEEAGFVEREPFLRDSMARGAYSDSQTVTSALRHRLLPHSRPELFVAQKYALLKYQPWMRPSAGLHYVAETRVAEQEMILAHFKYNAHFRAKAEAEVARGQHFNNAEEYRKYLALVKEGREIVFDKDISVPWRDCEAVRRILGDA